MQAPPPARAAEVRILSLGDSYTIGESVAAGDRWPARLAAALRARGARVSEPAIVARTGWTTDELSAGIDAARPRGPFDLVTLLIGVNDQYRGRPADEYRAQFHALLARSVQFAGGRAARVIVVSIPDWGVTPFGKRSGRDTRQIAAEIDAFNAVARDEATRAGAHFVDITPESRHAAARADLVAGD
ncbi:MAG TPA: GDSL-type esterase/lipase family protein, partial [Gemmatimonadaceae bacterium]|nr:GDSL-type esterase/lipase family protein [Gemmatimonadaceae bacterium]